MFVEVRNHPLRGIKRIEAVEEQEQNTKKPGYRKSNYPKDCELEVSWQEGTSRAVEVNRVRCRNLCENLVRGAGGTITVMAKKGLEDRGSLADQDLQIADSTVGCRDLDLQRSDSHPTCIGSHQLSITPYRIVA